MRERIRKKKKKNAKRLNATAMVITPGHAGRDGHSEPSTFRFLCDVSSYSLFESTSISAYGDLKNDGHRPRAYLILPLHWLNFGISEQFFFYRK